MQTQMDNEKNEVRKICLALEKNEVYMKLVNFISENKSEYHWQINGDVALFVDFAEAKEFYAIFDNLFQEDGLDATIFSSYIAVEMEIIADYCDFDLEHLFEPKND
jgi:hypothetical protein